MAEGGLLPAWFPAVTGFLAGSIFLRGIDMILPHLHIGFRRDQAEGVKTPWQKPILLVLAITLHNIPEGLAVGVAFGAAASGLNGATVAGAIALAIGIGLQNFPEGSASACKTSRKAWPLRSRSAGKACLAARASGMDSFPALSNPSPGSSEPTRSYKSSRCCPMPSVLPPGP